jgi:hypothetical protein
MHHSKGMENWIANTELYIAEIALMHSHQATEDKASGSTEKLKKILYSALIDSISKAYLGDGKDTNIKRYIQAINDLAPSAKQSVWDYVGIDLLCDWLTEQRGAFAGSPLETEIKKYEKLVIDATHIQADGRPMRISDVCPKKDTIRIYTKKIDQSKELEDFGLDTIFYRARTFLVHEFRDITMGIIEESAKKTAYYIPLWCSKEDKKPSCSDQNDPKWKASSYKFNNHTLSLVFPVSFYESLCREMLGELKEKGTQKQEEYFNSFKYDDRLLAFLKR